MNKQMRNQIFSALFILVIVLIGLGGLYYFMEHRIDYSTIDYIKDCQRGPNNFSDLANSINVKSVNDVGYQVKGKFHINIMYGDMVIDVPKPAFFNDEFKQRIGEIGIEYKYKENEETGEVKYRVTYWGDICDEYSTVN